MFSIPVRTDHTSLATGPKPVHFREWGDTSTCPLFMATGPAFTCEPDQRPAFVSSRFIFMPLLMITSPGLMPGLQGPTQVMVIDVSGRELPVSCMTMVILELKSPRMTPLEVRCRPAMLHVDVTLQEPSMLWTTFRVWKLVTSNGFTRAADTEQMHLPSPDRSFRQECPYIAKWGVETRAWNHEIPTRIDRHELALLIATFTLPQFGVRL